MVDAMEIMVLAILAPEARCDYNLETWQEGLITTVHNQLYCLSLLPQICLNHVTFADCVCWNAPRSWLVGHVHGQIWSKKSNGRCELVCFSLTFIYTVHVSRVSLFFVYLYL